MPQIEVKLLSKVEHLFDAGELDNALKILNDWQQFKTLDLSQKEHLQYLKGLILFYQNNTEELINLGKQIFQESFYQNNNLNLFDGLFFILAGKVTGFIFDQELFKQFAVADNLLIKLAKSPQSELLRRNSRLNLLKAMTYLTIGNLELADNHLKIILQKEKQLNDTFEIVWAYVLLARRNLQGRIHHRNAIKYSKKAFRLAKEIKFNNFWIAICYLGIGAIKYAIGEFEASLEHYMKSLAIYKQINNKWYMVNALNNIGNLYGDMGKYDKSLEFLEESLILWKQGLPTIQTGLGSIISTAFKKGDIKLARKYFNQLENLYHRQPSPDTELGYNYHKALLLKMSSRIRDKAEAEKLLKHVAETDLLAFDIKTNAVIHLCDLYLAEYRLNRNKEVLDDLDLLITKLLTFAEKSHSYLIFCETFILQAKIALLSFNIKAARRYLTNAQKIAESHGIKRLAIQISNEHDVLLEHLKIWEDLKESEAPFSKRLELAQINKQMEHMIKKRQIKIPEPIDEESVFLLIVSQGGVPFFSRSFTENKSFKDHLFGGFFSTINSFINETFSEGLDRALFGEYTLLIKSFPPFLIFYIYKGQSYSAQYRIGAFLSAIKSNQKLRQTINQFYQMNREINTQDIPSLDLLITKIFVDKTNPV